MPGTWSSTNLPRRLLDSQVRRRPTDPGSTPLRRGPALMPRSLWTAWQAAADGRASEAPRARLLPTRSLAQVRCANHTHCAMALRQNAPLPKYPRSVMRAQDATRKEAVSVDRPHRISRASASQRRIARLARDERWRRPPTAMPAAPPLPRIRRRALRHDDALAPQRGLLALLQLQEGGVDVVPFGSLPRIGFPPPDSGVRLLSISLRQEELK